MAIIKTPAAGVSPYQPTDTSPIVLRAGADGSTVLANTAAVTAAADAANVAAANSNATVIVNGQEALNNLINTSRSGVFEGANVTINLEEQNFNTTNQVTSTTNYAEGANGSIQYNNGSNGFAGDSYFTYTSGNVVTPGIRTDGYFYSNGAPFIGGGNAAIGNFVFNGDVMTIAHANGTMSITGNGTGNVNVSANSKAWIFGVDGNLSFPTNSLTIGNDAMGNPTVQAAANLNLQIVASGSEGVGGIEWFDNVNSPSRVAAVVVNNPFYGGNADVGIVTGDILGGSGNTYIWNFGNDGNLTLPDYANVSINYANGQPYGGGGGGGGNTFASITMTSTPAGAANNIQYGLGNLVSYLDGGWTIGEYNGNSFGTEGIRINPAIEGFADIVLPSQTDAAINPVSVNNYAGNVFIQSAGGTWKFNTDGNLVLPSSRRITTESGDISILPATDMYIQAGSGTVPGAGGSAVDIRSGSGQDGNSTNDGGYGGVVRFIGGDGGGAHGSGTNPGIGGEIYMRAGGGGQADVGNSVSAAAGAMATLYGGDGGYGFDDSNLAASGGNVLIQGGYGTYNETTEQRDGVGGNVLIQGGNWGATGATSGNVIIKGWTGSASLDWKFDNTGALNLPTGKPTLQEANNYPTLLAYGSGGHGGPELDYCDGNDPANIFENPNVYRNVLYLNGGGLYVGTNENGNANVAGGAGYNWQFTPTGNTILPLLNTERGDNPSGTIYGYTLNIGDGNHEAIITTPDGIANVTNSSQRLVINPGKGADGSSGEGGDIYLWAGRGGTGDGTTGGGSGGDIKIRGGQGMAQNAGGYIRIEAGDSHNDTGAGGYVNMFAGTTTGGTPGYVALQGGYNTAGNGGYISITGGYGSGGIGGEVNIIGGQSNLGTGSHGNVTVQTGSNTWTFDNTGILTLPVIYTGPGPSEQLKIGGTRAIVGTVGNSSVSWSGTSPTLVYTCTSGTVLSAKVTFVVESNNVTFGWEQFDVAVIQLLNGEVGVTVSNRMNYNPANGDTQVTADKNGGGQIQIYLAQPGSGTAYVNYVATEFNIMAD